MRVTRLEVFGFKSFMERLVLPLEGGVTGVVGPNGCGKSNIVDALRWVLGESKASNLRGGSLEDVIFNGTDKLRPLGLAEVTLTLRASEEGFFGDLTSNSLEAELLAGIEENAALAPAAESQPADSGTEAPADASAESAEETTPADAEGTTESEDEVPAAEGETASESRSIPQLRVLQGRRDEGAQDGATLSESLGIPTAAEELKANQISLSTRFAWLKSVNEVQITRRLYRSGESEFFINRVPCRLKDLRELFRAVGLGARANTIVAQGEVSRVVTAKPEERRLIIEEAAGVLGFRDKISSAGRRLEETSVNISRLDDIAKEVTRQVNSLRRQAGIAKNRAVLKQQVRELETALFQNRLFELGQKSKQLEGAAQQAEQQESNADAAVQKAQADEQAARGELLGIDVEGDEIRTKIDSIREELNARARQRGERSARLNEVRAFALARTTEIKRLEERKNTLAQRKDDCARELTQLAEQEQSVSEQLNSIERGGEEELKTIAAQLQQLRDELRRKDTSYREVRDRLVSSQSKSDSLQQQIISASPVSQLRKTMGERNADFLSGLSSEAKLLVDGLKVPPQYVRAVQAVLAERSEFLVSDQPHQIARRFVERAFKDDPNNKRGLGLGIIRRGAAPQRETSSEAAAPFPLLKAAIEYSDDVALAVTRMFDGVYVVPSLDEAISFLEAREQSGQSSGAITLVTMEGDLLTDYSFYSFRHEGGIIQLKNRLDELQTLVTDLSAQQHQISTERASLHSSIEAAEKRHAEVLRESQARQARLRELSNQLGNIRGRLHADKRLSEQLEIDAAKTGQQVEEAKLKIEEFRQEEERIQAEIALLVPDIDNQLRASLDELNKKYSAIDAVRRQNRDRLSSLANAFQKARGELDNVRRHRSELALDVQKIALELQNLDERILSEYGEEVLQSVKNIAADFAPLEHARRQEIQEELGRLRTRIQREGDVDPTAIERFEEESKRLEDLETQKKDLETAAATLKRTIERLTATSEERFIKTFREIAEHFSRLVPRLYGGGKGDLELTDPSKPLESGVEILIRPPGKKPKNIDLLSGGEKALCATALIFSMFLVRPGPLCVLDEVDAPLDEANLMRFLALIKEMSNKVQFIMITHNKQSMAMSDSLIGVTMLEPGASRVITVSLQEAYSQVA